MRAKWMGVAVMISIASAWTCDANASVMIDISQVGTDVIASGTGTLDLSGLLKNDVRTLAAAVRGEVAYFGSGPFGTVFIQAYTGISGPANIGDGQYLEEADLSSGDIFAFNIGPKDVFLSPSYVSGSPLSFKETFKFQTITALGLTNGSYTYTLPNDSFTVDVSGGIPLPPPAPPVAYVPLPGTASLFALSLVALGFSAGLKSRRQHS